MGVCVSKAHTSKVANSTDDGMAALDAHSVIPNVSAPNAAAHDSVQSAEQRREVPNPPNATSGNHLQIEKISEDQTSLGEKAFLQHKLCDCSLKITDLESEVARLQELLALNRAVSDRHVGAAAAISMPQNFDSANASCNESQAVQQVAQLSEYENVEALSNQSNIIDTNSTLSLKRQLSARDFDGTSFNSVSHHLEFDEDAEDEEMMQSFFDMIAADTGYITAGSMEHARTELKCGFLSTDPSLEEWERLAAALEAHLASSIGSKGIDRKTFKQFAVAEIPKMPGRVHWASSLNLGNALAKHLKPGNLFDGQRGIKEMTEVDVISACAVFAKRVPSIVVAAWRRLRDCKTLSAQDANSKFAMTEGAFAGKFATLDDFYRGVEHKLGQPNPKLHEGMLKEHCARPNAGTMFLAPNYGLCTAPRWEWQWTVAGADRASPYKDLQERLTASDGKYPGEVGDRVSQTIVRFSVQDCGACASLQLDSEGAAAESLAGRAAVAEALNTALQGDLASDAVGMLQSAEELLRGVVVAEPATVRDESVMMAVSLPFSRATFTETRLELLQQAVGRVSRVAAERVRVEEVTERVWVYSKYTSEGRLREALERMPLKDLAHLLRRQADSLGLDPSSVASCATRLQAALGAAPSESMTVREWCAGFDAEAQGVRDVIQDLVDAYADQTVAWTALGQHRKQGRTREGTAEELMVRADIAPIVARSKLKKEEFAALRLYTGPLYILYNALMRDFPLQVVESLAGNRYETTMFVIISGITKLAKVTPVPPKRLLYRGLGGMLLPEQFWKRTAQGFLGGVELGLMSTTADRSVAIQYSGHEKRRAMMLEIQAGRIDVGGSLGFLSQYAGEEEFLMQPLSCLEVTGRPRLDRTEKGEVLVVPIRVNVNLKSVTVEELTERRKILHLAMAKNLREELSYEAADNAERFFARATLRAKGVAEVLYGTAGLDPDACTVQLATNSLLGFPYQVLSSGKAYFELEILEAEKRRVLFLGAVGSNFWCDQHDRMGKQARLGWGNALSWGVYSIPAEEECSHFRLHDFDEELGILPSPWGGHFAVGDVIGVALDADSGSLAVSHNGSFAPPFGEAFSGVRPGPTVGAGLYFAFGGEKAKVRYNSGGRPLRFPPPGHEFQEVVARPKVDVSTLGLDADALVQLFQARYADHEAREAADFNDDQRYKELVNEVLDLKVRLLNKQRSLITMCEEGAIEAQIRRCVVAPFSDFGAGTLEAECPYKWKDVFCGLFVHKPLVEVPLSLAPAQVAMVWEAVIAAGESVKEVKLGAEILPARSLLSTLCLIGARLQYSKYGAAVAGLAMAGKGLTDVDLRGHEFEPAATHQLIEAVAGTASIMTINGCSLADLTDSEEQASVRRAIAAGCSSLVSTFKDVAFGSGADVESCVKPMGKAHRSSKQLGGWLDRADWAFVLARVQALEWSALVLKNQRLQTEGGRALASQVGQMTALRSLDLRENAIDSGCAVLIAKQLSSLSALRSLDLRGNKLGSKGWGDILNCISRVTWLDMLNGASAAWYRSLASSSQTALDVAARDLRDDGAAIVSAVALQPSAAVLTALDISGNMLDGNGGTILASALGGLCILRELYLGFNKLGYDGGTAIASVLSCLTALELLDLQSNFLSSSAAKDLAKGLCGQPALRELYLQLNLIRGDAGSAIAGTLSTLSRLELLDLDGNELGAVACETILRSVSCLTALRMLDLQRNGIDPTVAELMIGRNSHLAGLDLEIRLSEEVPDQ